MILGKDSVMSRKYKNWIKGLLFSLVLLSIQIVPGVIKAGGLLDLRGVDVLDIPYEGAFLDTGNEVLFSDKYLKNNMLAFPPYRKIKVGSSLYYSFDARDFFTVVSIYHLYRSFPRYYKTVLDYAVSADKISQQLAIAYGEEKQRNVAVSLRGEYYKQSYEHELKKKKIRNKKVRVQIILWAVGGVVLGASLGVVSGIFVEKYY